MNTFLKTLPKRHKTNKTGIYYKEIEKTVIDDKGKTKKSISDKVYSIQYKDIDDKWKFKTIGKYSEGIRENYCNTKRTEIMNLVKLGEQPELIKKKQKKKIITLDEVFQLYKIQKKSESKDIIKTEQKYKSNIFKIFGNVDIMEVTTDKIIKFRQTLIDKELAGSTINSNISFIGTLFNVAIEEKLYDKVNPIKSKKLKAIKLDNARERYLSLEEIETLYKEIKDDEELTLFVKLSLITGGRLETVLHIQKKDIKLEDGTITLKDFKTNKTYQGFLSDDLITYLSSYLKGLTSNYYVVGGLTTKKPTRTLSRHLKIVLDDNFNVGLKIRDTKNRAVIHTLRHTFASHLAINGVPIFNIKELMNHSDINMTMRYAKLAPSSGKIAIKELYK